MSCCGKATGAIQQAGKAIVEKVATKFATPEVRAERMVLCLACPKIKILKKEYISMCNVCKCIVEGKTWLADQHCPLEKW
jgi:cell division ATPase FtsA